MTRGSQTRAAIVQEALAAASILGLGALTIGQLAKRLGLSKSGLFAHFGSKESLQLAVLEEVVERFVHQVIRPAVKAPSGEERLRTLYARWIAWAGTKGFPGGCPLMAASIEFDDQPGPIHDYVVDHQRLWMQTIGRMARKAVGEKAFAPDLDIEQFTFEFNAVGLGFNYALRLHRDTEAAERARAAFEHVMQRAKSTHYGA